MNQIKIGSFIAELRKEKNMTQRILAEKLGVTDRAISKWENGRGLPDVSLMKPLCETLGINVTELLNGERVKETDTSDKTEETVYDVLSDREIHIKNTERVKKKYLAMRAVSIVLIVMGMTLVFMIASGLRGEGYSVYTAIQTQKAKMLSNLIVEEKYDTAVKYIGFSQVNKDNARENWIKSMEAFSKEVEIESIDISPIILEDYFPMGTYEIIVCDSKSQIRYIYDGLVTYQNGGITFCHVNIANGSVDIRRDAIGYMLNDIFTTYYPG